MRNNSNDDKYSSKYTSSYNNKWTNSSNTNKYSSINDDRRNRFDDQRNNNYDKYTSSSNLNMDYPERPTWRSSFFNERSRSETRFSESARGKTPAQILKELREKNLETIKQKKKERGEEVSDDENTTESKTETMNEIRSEPKRIIVDDSDSDSESEDLNDDDDDDDELPLNILEGGENKGKYNL